MSDLKENPTRLLGSVPEQATQAANPLTQTAETAETSETPEITEVTEATNVQTTANLAEPLANSAEPAMPETLDQNLDTAAVNLEPPTLEVKEEVETVEAVNPNAQQEPANLESTQEQVNPKSELIEHPVENQLETQKKFTGVEAIKNADNINNLLEAYQQLSKENSFNLAKLIEIQREMAKKLLELGHSEKAIDFTLLAEQSSNILYSQNNVKELTELIERTLPNKISNLLDGLEEQEKRRMRKANY
jgi:hypothetical protein